MSAKQYIHAHPPHPPVNARKRANWGEQVSGVRIYQKTLPFEGAETHVEQPVVLTAKGLQGTGPAPKGDRRWLAAFLPPEVCRLIQEPPVIRRRSS